MQSIAPNILINFQEEKLPTQQKEYNQQVWGSIQFKIQQLESYKEIQRFTTCKCKMILTVQDKYQIYDWEEISTNRKIFPIQDIKKVEIDHRNNVIWKCRFCSANNIIKKQQIVFAENKSKIVHKIPNKSGKKQPIILIVFDSSASMEQHIFESIKKNESDPKIQKLMNRIKETKIYKKIVKEEEKAIQQLIKKHKVNIEGQCDFSQKYEDHLKKNKLLMSITELAIEKNTWKVNIMDRKTIGFIFFNSVIKLPTQGNTVKTIYHQYDNCKDQKKQKVDFEHFQSLYNLGENYASNFSTPFNQLNFEKLNLQVSNPQGQTALGPAIVIALGVVSKHGPGSTIIVVTDGIANKGIFEQTSNWDAEYQMLKMRLIKFKASLVMLEWKNINRKKEQNVERQNTFQTQNKLNLNSFCKMNKSQNGGIGITQNIVILANNSPMDNQIQDIQKKVDACIHRNNSIWNDEIVLKCENPNIDYEKSIKKIGNVFNKPPYYLLSQIYHQNLKEIDYLHPFMTQVIVKYKDVKTGEEATFMSYIMQKLVKYKDLKKKDKKKMKVRAL